MRCLIVRLRRRGGSFRGEGGREGVETEEILYD